MIIHASDTVRDEKIVGLRLSLSTLCWLSFITNQLNCISVTKSIIGWVHRASRLAFSGRRGGSALSLGQSPNSQTIIFLYKFVSISPIYHLFVSKVNYGEFSSLAMTHIEHTRKN